VDGVRNLLIEALQEDKTRIALEFVREFWRRMGRCRVCGSSPRRGSHTALGRKGG